jgi:hypothetical protein
MAIENLIREQGGTFNDKVTTVTNVSGITFIVSPFIQASFSVTSPLVVRFADQVKTVTSGTMSLLLDHATDTFGLEATTSMSVSLCFGLTTTNALVLVLGATPSSGKVTTDTANKRTSILSTATVMLKEVSKPIYRLALQRNANTWSIRNVYQ